MFVSGDEISRNEHNLLNAGTDPAVEEVLLLVWDEDSALDWIRKHNPELIGVAPNGWEEKLAAGDTTSMPDDITAILEYLAASPQIYGNSLKWNEKAKLKADLMHNTAAWRRTSSDQVKRKCLELGMSLEDANLVSDLVKKRLEGKRLVSDRGYANFQFQH